MASLSDGQCGLCKHFGEHHTTDGKLLQLRREKQAPENLSEECGHPMHAPLHLKVTVISGCDGFEKAEMN